MEYKLTNIPEIITIQPSVFTDARGFFMETYREAEYAAAGIHGIFVQDNHSGSMRGTLRGLHYQIRHSQGKLVRVSSGKIFDVAVDLRRSSRYFGQWVGEILSAENKHQLWIPPGFAHGFYVLSEWADVLYKATDYYAPEWDRTLLWNDPEVGIDWPLIEEAAINISEKDAGGLSLSNAETFD
jgi:dTDP-4-dehydrorhamnose 3,5-epimerase